MELDRAAGVAWIRAVEETDPDGTVLSEAVRVDASRAMGKERDGEVFLSGRAELLASELSGRHAAPERIGVPGLVKWGLVTCAFVGGVVVDRFEGGREINVLAFPLMGLLAWNLVLYVLMVVGILKGGGAHGGAGWIGGIVKHWCGRERDPTRARFFEYWWPVLARRETGGMRVALHLAAAAAALGVVAGMYWRGLATEYRAVWESTFLSASAAGDFLGVVLWPASAISGQAIPELGAEVFGREETATWIHLFAVTASLVIVFPRLLLAAAWKMRVVRLQRSVQLDGEGWERYEEELRNALRGGATVVDVVPFASGLDDAGKKAVRSYVVQRWGGGAIVEFGEVVRYGEEDEFVAGRGPEQGGVTVVVFQLTATPEDEVQGQFMRGVRRRSEGEVLMLVDGRGFEKRFGTMPEYGRRLEERRSAWLSVIRGDGFETAILGGEA